MSVCWSVGLVGRSVWLAGWSICTLYYVLWNLYPVLCTLYSVLCNLFYVLWNLCPVLCTLYSVLCTLQYCVGMKPVMYSVVEAAKSGVGWTRVGDLIRLFNLKHTFITDLFPHCFRPLFIHFLNNFIFSATTAAWFVFQDFWNSLFCNACLSVIF